MAQAATGSARPYPSMTGKMQRCGETAAVSRRCNPRKMPPLTALIEKNEMQHEDGGAFPLGREDSRLGAEKPNMSRCLARRRLQPELQLVEARAPEEFEAAFAAATRGNAGAVIAFDDARHSGRATDQVRLGHQSQGCKSAGYPIIIDPPRPRRRGERIVQGGMSVSGTKQLLSGVDRTYWSSRLTSASEPRRTWADIRPVTPEPPSPVDVSRI